MNGTIKVEREKGNLLWSGVYLMSKRRDKKLNKETSRRTQVLLTRAWRMLQNMTPMERKLERALLTRGVLYRPQWLMEPWIVDFYLVDHKIVIEVDGSSHDDKEHDDWTRTAGLLRRNDVRRVVWVTNEQVADGVSIDRLISGEYDHSKPEGYVTRRQVKRAELVAEQARRVAALAARPSVIIRKPDTLNKYVIAWQGVTAGDK